MSDGPLALEIRDTGILCVGAHGALAPASPGYALLDGETQEFGRSAEASSRTKPRRTHSRFWQQLDREALQAPFPSQVSVADLVFRHLESVWSGLQRDPEAVVLVVPGIYSPDQHGLLLGIARACGIPVEGMVDAALAAAVPVAGDRFVHVDLMLHQAVVTLLQRGEALVRERVEVGAGLGVVAFNEAIGKGIARAFVRRTRFDPLHAATTEQELWNRLPEWLARLGADRTSTLNMRSPHGDRSIEWTFEELLESTGDLYRSLERLTGSVLGADDQRTTLLVTPRVSAFPGLSALLAAMTAGACIEQHESAAGLGALVESGNLRSRGEAVPFVTSLSSPPELRAPNDPSDAEPTLPTRAPTHLLWLDRAFPITAQPLILGTSRATTGRSLQLKGSTAGISRFHCSVFQEGSRVFVEDHSTYGTFLNGRPVSSKAHLAVGDNLRLGSPGIEVSLIRVESEDGSS